MKKIFNSTLFILFTFLSITFTHAQVFDLANYGENPDSPLTFKEAFHLQVETEGNKITVHLKTEHGHYLYKEKLSLSLSDGSLDDNATWENISFKDDEYFGITPIIENRGSVTFYIYDTETTILSITAQGCSKEGICYLPNTQKFALNNIEFTNNEVVKATSEDKEYSYWSFILIGFLIALTPCTFPLIPIVLGTMGKNKTISSIAYFHGLAATFITIGVLTTMSGSLILPYINNIYTSVLIAILFLTVGLLLNKDIGISVGQNTANKVEGLFKNINSETIKAFSIGMASGVLATPCTAAPLLAVFTHLSLEANTTYTISALYFTSLGLSVPLIGIAIVGKQALIRPGNWMIHVKSLVAAGIIGYPIVMLNDYNYGIAITYSCIASILIIIAFKGKQKLYWAIPMILALLINSDKTQEPTEVVTNLSQLNSGNVILKIEADWCTTCKANSKEIEKANKKDYKTLSLDVTELNKMEEAYLKKHKILGVPMIHIIYNGKIIKKISGDISHEELTNSLI